MKRPWLSVIMPTYNGAAYLETALESIIVQAERDLEVIAIDDGSMDGTLGILKAYSERLPMTVIERSHSGNWVVNTNLGMSLARGRYFCWLHQDDAWCPDRLAELRRLTCQWPEVSFIVHPVWFIDRTGNRVGRWRCPLPGRRGRVSVETVLGHLLIQCFISAPGPIFKAEAVSDVGGMDERLWFTADWDFWLKLAALGPTVYHPGLLASFRIHPASQTSRCPARLDEAKQQYSVVMARHLAAWERRKHDVARISRIAHFSAEVNVALMRVMRGQHVGWFRLLWDFAQLGPIGWHAYLRDSRIVERVVSRVRARAVAPILPGADCRGPWKQTPSAEKPECVKTGAAGREATRTREVVGSEFARGFVLRRDPSPFKLSLLARVMEQR
jgi:GT2 family glycosyltransferase